GSAKFPGQAISLKDATSQELFTATEQERNFQLRSSRNATIFHHPTLHNFNLPHLSVGANDSELEERILQHLAAATAMGRAHHFARRESQRTSSNKGHSPYMVFSPNSDIGPSGPVSGITSQRRREHERNPLVTGVSPSAPVLFPLRYLLYGMEKNLLNLDQYCLLFTSRSSSINRDRAGPSDFQSFSESLKSRLNLVSMRYILTSRRFLLQFLLFSPYIKDTKSQSQRVQEDGRKGCSLGAVPLKILVQKLQER
ncbi:hypothetical protein C5167_013446, partial [Papaver somniferum]